MSKMYGKSDIFSMNREYASVNSQYCKNIPIILTIVRVSDTCISSIRGEN